MISINLPRLREESNSDITEEEEHKITEEKTAEIYSDEEISEESTEDTLFTEKFIRRKYRRQLKTIEKYFELELDLGFDHYSLKGKVGLKNLGNTCFMNSGI